MSCPFRYYYILILSFIILAFSCKKFVQINPPATEITGTTVYSNNATAEAVMTGLYDKMITAPGLSSGSLSIGFLMGLASDEMTNYSSTNAEQAQFYQNALTSFSNNASNYYFWTELYADIYTTNAVLEGLANSSGIDSSVRQQLTGEAEFMRAFLHFYATNLYGDVPLVTTTNYQTNNTISRTPKADVYKQIIADLKDAEERLNAGFVDQTGASTVNRIRPNQGTAAALLARVYLYTQKWDSAVQAATTVINNPLYGLDSLNEIFLANSTEAIWQLCPSRPGYNTWDAYSYVLQGSPATRGGVSLSPYLTNAFESGDARLANWVGAYTSNNKTYYYAYKYKVSKTNQPVTEYTMVFRLAEQYLIRAEAEAELGDMSDAARDLNIIRTRAGLSASPTLTSNSSIQQADSAIQHERQIELFSEWGHRWFDLSRTDSLNSRMGVPGGVCQSKGGIWNQDWALLPIALQETQINSNLHQNPGY